MLSITVMLVIKCLSRAKTKLALDVFSTEMGDLNILIKMLKIVYLKGREREIDFCLLPKCPQQTILCQAEPRTANAGSD